MFWLVPLLIKEQDEQLISQVRALNDYIRKLNIRLQKISPNFSQDIYHKKSSNSKNKHQQVFPEMLGYKQDMIEVS
jgi:hypothetical protein